MRKQPRCLAAAAAVLLVSQLLCFARSNTALPGPGRAFAGCRVADHSQLSADRRPRAVAMRVQGQGALRWRISQNPLITGVTEVRDIPNRFGPQGTGDPAEARTHNSVFPSGPLQRYQFTQMNVQGHNLSEVFVRFPGRTPWKKIGELASKTGDFEEAARAQWTILLKRSFDLYPKVRFWLPSDTPIEFGYADANADVVSVKDPLPEGIRPENLKVMLANCGFFAAEKELVYLPAKRHVLDKIGPTGLKKGWHMTGRGYLQYRALLKEPIWAQDWAQRSIEKHKYQQGGVGVRSVDWYGGMGQWAAKSHHQGIAAGGGGGGTRSQRRKKMKFPSGGKNNVKAFWNEKPWLKIKRRPEGLPIRNNHIYDKNKW